MQRQYDSVKLHVTLINTLFRRRDDNDDSKRNARRTFDAREILRRFSAFNFGSQVITEINLSLRHSTACDGFYEATAVIKL